MTDLITRLEEAAQGSRELDVLIQNALRPHDNSVWWMAQPPVTTSLDAALALAERVLPGCLVSLFLHGNATASVECKTAGRVKTEGLATTPALALCLAILKATRTSHDHAA